MSFNKTTPQEEPAVNTEVEWGRTYRHQRKQARKVSIAPTPSPFNIQRLWEQYQMSKELEEIKELKRKLAASPVVRIPKIPKGRIDPNTITKKKYYEYMSTPRQYHEPPSPPNPLEKKHRKEECSPRLIRLALPTKKRVLQTWKDYQYSLPIDFITRLEELLHTDHNLDPKFARCYFKTLDRKKRKQCCKLRRQCQKKMRQKKKKEKEWLNLQIKTTVDQIIKFLKKEPLFALNFKQMMLSDAVMDKLKERGDIKTKPPRNTNKPYWRAIVDIVDQLSVWIDTIVRYVDVQYTESVEEIVEAPSIESLLGEEEEEEIEEEAEVTPKRFTLPPLPALPEMPPLPEVPGMMPLIKEEAEGDSTYGTTTAIEAVLGDVAAVGVEAEGGDISIGEDMLDMLIQILSYSTPEMLDQLVNPDILPEVTYGDVLERLKTLRDEVLAEKKKMRQAALEEAILAWAKANEPDKVDEKLIGKIQDTAGIISECLMREARAPVIKAAETEKVWESAEETTYSPSETEPSEVAPSVVIPSEVEGASDAELLAGTETVEEVQLRADVTGEDLETVPEEGESEMKSTEGPTLETLEIMQFTEGGEEEEISEYFEEPSSSIGPMAIQHKESTTKLPTVSKVSEVSEMSGPDQEFPGSLDMTGELKVVMGEGEGLIPELSQNVLGISLSEYEARQQAERAKAESVKVPSKEPSIQPSEPFLVQEEKPGPSISSIPKIIPGHQPSKVFEHQPDTICCLTLKVWATWLLEVAHNAHAWSRWLNDIINEVRRIASIIRGEIKDENGQPVVFYKEDWIEFSEKVDNMITSWRQYSMHVKDLTDKIVHNFRGKTVTCCPKCLEDNLIVDVTLAHNISQQLAEAMNTAGYWRRWLDSVVMETKRLTGAALTDNESQASSYGTMEIIELHEPHAAESEESLYEIEELDPNNQN